MIKIRRRTIIVLVLAIGLGAALLHVSQLVQQAEKRYAALERNYAQEQENIRVLRAEQAYLNSPARLEELAKDYLDMTAPEPDQMQTSYEAVPETPKVPVPPKKFFHNISQDPSPSAAKENDETPAPIRKPQKEMQSFDSLLGKTSEQGGAP